MDLHYSPHLFSNTNIATITLYLLEKPTSAHLCASCARTAQFISTGIKSSPSLFHSVTRSYYYFLTTFLSHPPIRDEPVPKFQIPRKGLTFI